VKVGGMSQIEREKQHTSQDNVAVALAGRCQRQVINQDAREYVILRLRLKLPQLCELLGFLGIQCPTIR